MRIALVYEPRPQTWPKFQWVHDGLLNLGHDIFHVPQDFGALEHADKTCDLVLFEQKEPGLGRKNIIRYAKEKRSTWVQWWFDLLLGMPENQHSNYMGLYGDLARVMDFVLVKERGLLWDYAQQGIKAKYVDQGCPDNWPEAPKQNREFDVLVFGTKMDEYDIRRTDVVTLLGSGISVAWAGRGGPVPEGCIDLDFVHAWQIPNLIGRAGVVLCTDLRIDLDGYWSDRIWMAGGAGAAVVHHHRTSGPQFPHLFSGHYTGIVREVKMLLSDDSLRTGMQSASRRVVMATQTYSQICERWLHEIGIGKQSDSVTGAVCEVPR